jgi:hypothetical protein
MCSRENACDHTRDTQTCTDSCNNGCAAFLPKVRADVAGAIDTCFAQADCATVLAPGLLATCVDQAVASVAPSSVGMSFCSDLANAHRQCGTGPVDPVSCLNLVKLFGDSALQEADSCVSKACGIIDSCVSAALPECTGGGSSSGGSGSSSGIASGSSSSGGTGSSSGSSSGSTSGSSSGSGSSSSSGSGSGSSSGSGPGGPTGNHLLATANLLEVGAVTSDGYAIYTDMSDASVWALPVTGGTPQKIASNVGSYTLIIADGPVALIWANINGTTNVGQLIAWTAAKGAHTLSAASSFGGSLSKDQSHFIFFDVSSTTGTSIAVAGVDGTGKTQLVPLAAVSTQCPPAIGWAGNDAIAAYCTVTPPADAGAGSAIVARYTGASWTPIDISTSAYSSFAGNQAGDHVVFFDTAGLESYAVGTGTTTLLDAAGDSFVITPDGTRVVYGTHTGSVVGPFKITPIASASPATLGSGITAFTSISPNGNWVLGFTQESTTNLTNTILASVITGGTPTTLVASPTSALFGDSFTTDSRFAIYTDTVTATTTASGSVTTGHLNVVALGPGTPPMALANGAWQDAAGPGSKVVFNQNWAAPANLGFGTADLSEVDLSAAVPTAHPLVLRADANFFLTADRSTIVYSYSTGASGQPTAASGLWAMPVP